MIEDIGFKAIVTALLAWIALSSVFLVVVAGEIQADTRRCAVSLEAIQTAVDRLP